MKTLMTIVALSAILLSMAPHAKAAEASQEGLKVTEDAWGLYLPAAGVARGEINASEVDRETMDNQLRPEVREPVDVSTDRGTED